MVSVGVAGAAEVSSQGPALQGLSWGRPAIPHHGATAEGSRAGRRVSRVAEEGGRHAAGLEVVSKVSRGLWRPELSAWRARWEATWARQT